MNRPDNCPHCGVSLIGGPLPEKHIHMYNAPDAKPGDPGWVTHGRREIGIEVLGVYDGILFYECPDCHGTWHRFPDTPYYERLYKAADKHMNKADRRLETSRREAFKKGRDT